MRVERGQSCRQFVVPSYLAYKFIVPAIMLDRCFAHETAAFDAPVILRDRERVRVAHFRHLDPFDRLAVDRNKMWVRAVAQKVGIEARFLTNWSRPLTAIPERNGYRRIGVTG